MGAVELFGFWWAVFAGRGGADRGQGGPTLWMKGKVSFFMNEGLPCNRKRGGNKGEERDGLGELGQRIIDRALIRCLSHQGIIRLLGIGRQGRMTREDGQSHDGVR